MPHLPDAVANLEILRAACCVAAQDGRISSSERPLIERLAERAGVGAVSLDAMIEQAEGDPAFSREQFTIVRTDPVPTIRALAAVARADGTVSDQEREVLARFARRLGVGEERLRALLGEPGDESGR